MTRTKRVPETIELDLGRYELRRGERRVKLEKKPMELLIFLVGRREQLVSREEIVAKLWGSNLFIDTEPNINNIVRKIRAAIGDTAEKPRILETVVGKGYRFVGALRVIGGRLQESEFERDRADESERARAPVRGERTSLAVLPLIVFGNIPDDQGVSLGFADALVARLGNLEGMDVLPTSAVLNIPDELTAADVASRLGARFVVRGGMRESKGRWELSLEVYDAHLRGACFKRKCPLDMSRLFELEDEIARQIANTLKRPLRTPLAGRRTRYSKDPMAYAEFVRGFGLSSSGDSALLDNAAQHLSTAVARDPGFALAHATLSLVCATRHFEFDPGSVWLEKAEFHCTRALELDADLPEGHVAKAFLLWGPSKNFQHVEAIAELRKALTLQNNLPHAYNRLGTILAHVGLLEHAREMYERGRAFHAQKKVSHSIVQVHIWSREYDLARQEIHSWRMENPGSKYPLYFAPQPAMMTGDWKEAKALLDEALRLLPEEPLIISLEGVFYALKGKTKEAMECVSRACAIPRSFGHAHHTYYQIACTLAVLGQTNAAFEWLERSVGTGFACWPFFVKDPCLKNLGGLAEFDVLVSALQAKYPDHLGLI